ncbi:MAG: recombinase family protein [Bacteroidetes bacterium]|nr:MAG: recombinase family protein [Bacteroidota bacterium]
MKELIYVAYYRVSTKKQGESGLGLEAQQAEVRKFAGQNLIAEFVEIESGKKKNRKQLELAIEVCKAKGATLLTAKLDRLLRSLEILVALRTAKIEFKAIDCLNDNAMIISIKASFAEEELQKISERTKKALQAKKAQGFKLGKPENLTKAAQKKAIEANIKKAANNQNNITATELIRLYLKENISYCQISKLLNNKNIKTSQGKMFRYIQVKRLVLRMEKDLKKV